MTTGYIDPALLPPRTRPQHELYKLIRANGCSLHRLHADSKAVRLTGPGGLHLTLSDLHLLTPHDITRNLKD